MGTLTIRLPWDHTAIGPRFRATLAHLRQRIHREIARPAHAPCRWSDGYLPWYVPDLRPTRELIAERRSGRR